jgi:BASS family bile acid:Na+ symporter
VQQAAVTVLVVVMMLAIGLRTPVDELLDVWRRPAALIGALVANVLAAPLLTLGALRLVPLPAAVVAGLMICAACPGGATGPLFAGAAGASLAIAVTAMVSLSM